ncbi:hypothetical protein [Amycolatopsis sp. RTGN1]|uniref:hypothetical protein n=1 Tax=Amycolatopsis ponsaeliensis TaxID=2992142 RepID=UPI00254FF842|nr:hypothetical protein [Amycolatopsis sp. RTGN1]
METVEAIAVGILSSVVASALWILILSRLTPKLIISPEIAEDPVSPVFRIKVVNLSRRAAVDLRVEAHLVTPIGARGGSVNRRTTLKCGNPPLVLPRRDRSSKEHDNAYRLRIDSNVRELQSAHSSSFIRLQIFARHEVTGMGKMFEQRYHHPSSEIVVGSFVHGHDMTLVPEEPQTRRRSEAQRDSS